MTSCNALSDRFSKMIITSYLPLPPTGMTCFPAENFLRRWVTVSVGADSACRVQIGPPRSESASAWTGAATMGFSGEGSGAVSAYVIVMVFPGFRFSFSTVPTFSESVCPGPSTALCSGSRVTPSTISILHWSVGMESPLTRTTISSALGALNIPGMSSVIRIMLIVADPVFVTVMVDSTFCSR